LGWIGERSTPITSAEGCRSAISLFPSISSRVFLDRAKTYMAHIPVPQPTSKMFCWLQVSIPGTTDW
jgi:hypothetical protein